MILHDDEYMWKHHKSKSRPYYDTTDDDICMTSYPNLKIIFLGVAADLEVS